MPVDQLAALLDRWRRADGVFGRGRILAEAIRQLRGLTPDERRDLARVLSERGAPQIAAQLEQVSGGSLDPEQVRGIADHLLQMEEDDLARLVDDLRDPQARGQMVQEAVDRHLGGAPPPPPGAPGPPPGAAASGTHDRAGPPSDPDESLAQAQRRLEDQRAQLARLPAQDALADAGEHGGRPGDTPLQDIALGGVELGEVELGGVDLGAADLVETGLVEAPVVAAPASPDATTAADAADPDDPATTGADSATADSATAAAGATATGATATGAAATGAAATAGVTAGVPGAAPREHRSQDTAAIAHPVVVGSPADPGRDLGEIIDDAVPEPDAASTSPGPGSATQRRDALLATLRGCDQAMARLRLLDAVTSASLEPTATLDLLDAFPPGWQRRRAVTRLASAGVLDGVDPRAVLARFERRGDLAFVASSLVHDAGVAPDALEGLVDAPVIRRLAVDRSR